MTFLVYGLLCFWSFYCGACHARNRMDLKIARMISRGELPVDKYRWRYEDQEIHEAAQRIDGGLYGRSRGLLEIPRKPLFRGKRRATGEPPCPTS